MNSDHDQPTPAVTPGADPTQHRDDPRQGEAALTDPAQAAAAEFTPTEAPAAHRTTDDPGH